MTDVTPSSPGAPGDDGKTAERMRAIAAELNAAGLTARVNETRGVLDVTATVERTGYKSAEIIVDEDLYVQISYWNSPDATPAHVTAVISRALAAIATASR